MRHNPTSKAAAKSYGYSLYYKGKLTKTVYHTQKGAHIRASLLTDKNGIVKVIRNKDMVIVETHTPRGFSLTN